MDPENTQYLKIDNYPEDQGRVETGVVQFNDDWPGIFIRGDNALHFAMMLNMFIEKPNDPIARMMAENLRNLLQECAIRPNK